MEKEKTAPVSVSAAAETNQPKEIKVWTNRFEDPVKQALKQPLLWYLPPSVDQHYLRSK